MTIGRFRQLPGRLRGEASPEAAEDFAPIVRAIGALESEIAGLSDAELRRRAFIAEAGSVGAVTISTKMAGRGVDIRLDGVH